MLDITSFLDPDHVFIPAPHCHLCAYACEHYDSQNNRTGYDCSIGQNLLDCDKFVDKRPWICAECKNRNAETNQCMNGIDMKDTIYGKETWRSSCNEFIPKTETFAKVKQKEKPRIVSKEVKSVGCGLEPDKVREIALSIMDGSCPWDFDGPEDVSYMKVLMYNTGVLDMANAVIKAIEELKNA